MTVNNSLHLVEQRKRADLVAALLSQAFEDVRALGKNPESLIRWEFALKKIEPVLAELRDGHNAELLKRAEDVRAEFERRTLFSPDYCPACGNEPATCSVNHGGGK